jgi:mono/diheme cytochrome c family protein
MTSLRLFAACGILLSLTPYGLRAQAAKDLYLDKCSSCHGPEGDAKTAKGRKLKVKPVAETAARISKDEMIAIVTSGKGVDMAAYNKELTKLQIDAVVDYYRGLAKK